MIELEGDKHFTIPEAAAIAKVSTRAVKSWISEDLLPTLTIDNRKYIRGKALRTLMADRIRSPRGQIPRTRTKDA